MAYKVKGSFLKPFKSLKYIGQKPVTIRVPYEERPTAERYRGFHTNDWDKCIGCGTCAEICDNDAIRMIEIPSLKPDVGKTNLRPAIDYGRCCWCALCVDVCTTNSLKMTREYTHLDEDLDSFFILPTEEGIHKIEYPDGYIADEKINFLDLERVPMKQLSAEESITLFVEIVKGFSKEEAIKEASRCVGCGICTDTCPAHMNIPEYIEAIWNDDVGESARQIYKTNPLPEVCGRICTHKCETACSIGVRGEPVSIRWLKRYAMDNLPFDQYEKAINGEVVKHVDKKVAMVGSGPSSLSAAYYLALMGYKIKIYESLPEPGGMMRYGIPEYRLPYDQLDKDVNFIKKLGVEIVCNTVVGKDITLEQLHEKNNAVLIATGLHLGRSTRVPGTDHENVFQAIALLRNITMGKNIKVEKKIVVIGGGNVAMDIARSLARLQKQKYNEVNIIVTSLETLDIIPADLEEIEEAKEEGIVFRFGRGPKEIVIENNEIKGLSTVKCLSVFNEQHMFSPTFDENDKMFLEGSMVVEAIGQAPDMSYLNENINKMLEYSGRRIKVDEYYQTNLEWLFVAGDIVKGPDVINGIASGHKAALGIDKYLSKQKIKEITTVDEILDIAYDFENNSYNFYRKFLDKFSSPVKEIIRDLMLEEGKHRERIKEIRENKNIAINLIEGLKRPQLVSNFTKVMKPVAINKDSSVENVLLTAIERERHAYGFYSELKKLTKDKEIEFFLNYLRDEELKHLQRVENIYNSEIYKTV